MRNIVREVVQLGFVQGTGSLRAVTTVSFVAVTLLASPAQAVPILESHTNLAGLAAAADAAVTDGLISSEFRDEINGGAGLIFSGNLNDAGSRDVGDVNGKLLGRTVDYLGRFNGDATTFDSDVIQIDDSQVSAFNMVLSNSDGLISWNFDQTGLGFGVDWNIIKVGLKYGGGEGPAYFLIDPLSGSDSGSIDMADYNTLLNYDSIDHAGDFFFADGDTLEDFQLAQFYQFHEINDGPVCTGRPQDRDCPLIGYSYNLLGLSHIDIYGTPNSVSVPEPATLALFGLGLAGLGFARRRRTH